MLRTINLTNKKVLELLEKRAAAENRTPTNAANTTIIEALSGKYASCPQGTQKPEGLQGESCEPVS